MSPLVAPIAPRDQLGDGNYAALYEKLTGSSWQQRPACRQVRMIAVEVLAPARPAFIDTSQSLWFEFDHNPQPLFGATAQVCLDSLQLRLSPNENSRFSPAGFHSRVLRCPQICPTISPQ